MTRRLPLLAAALLALFLLSAPTHADERIGNYHSEIVIVPDGSLRVTETITITCENRQINHGIYRDFPTRYTTTFGFHYDVPFAVEAVLKNGQPEPYALEDFENGVRIRIGDAGLTLDPGQYTYTIAYTTDRQLGFYPDRTELNWNVTGTGWVFPIDAASATVTLPAAAAGAALTTDGFTGPQDSREKNFTAARDERGRPVFSTTSPLAANEGLTIVVSFPPGLIAPNPRYVGAPAFLRDNLGILLGFAGLLLVFTYYLVVWMMVGIDPAKGIVIPLFAPPDGISPAAARYVTRMGFDPKTFAVAAVSMAVKGWLTIREDDPFAKPELAALPAAQQKMVSTIGGLFKQLVYVLERRTDGGRPLAAEEQKLAAALGLAQPGGSVRLEQKNHRQLRRAMDETESSLRRDYETTHFLRNRAWFSGGLGLTILALLVMVIAEGGATGAVVIFLVVWLTIWSFAVVVLLREAVRKWAAALRRRPVSVFDCLGALFLTLFSLPFLAGEVGGLIFLVMMSSVWTGLVLGALVFLNVVFFHLLTAPTRLGRGLLDQLEGFRMYLAVTEKERLRQLNAPSDNLELYEKYLPYAMALEVEEAWGARFADQLATAALDPATGSRHSWYAGSSLGSLGAAGFASGLSSSFAGACAASSTAPGRSGGSGGGSSGGGGGGGGGGGW